MLIKLHRMASHLDSTLGMIHIDDKFECFTLEDEKRDVKIMHETRIPAGKYEILFREDPSPMTTRYRDRFDWFNWHLHLQNVTGFSNVYIHSGNTDDHTSGCILVGYQGWKLPNGEYEIHRSVDAYRDLYAKIKAVLKTGEKVQIEISVFK